MTGIDPSPSPTASPTCGCSSGSTSLKRSLHSGTLVWNLKSGCRLLSSSNRPFSGSMLVFQNETQSLKSTNQAVVDFLGDGVDRSPLRSRTYTPQHPRIRANSPCGSNDVKNQGLLNDQRSIVGWIGAPSEGDPSQPKRSLSTSVCPQPFKSAPIVPHEGRGLRASLRSLLNRGLLSTL